MESNCPQEGRVPSSVPSGNDQTKEKTEVTRHNLGQGRKAPRFRGDVNKNLVSTPLRRPHTLNSPLGGALSPTP